MSVDLVDSARLSAEVDPEVLADLLKSYKERVALQITAAAGRVARSPGDGVLAYFGWPQAREDAAECAVRSGFQVIAEVGRLQGPDGLPLRCRIGVATGLVVISGEGGEGAASEVAIAGEAPNLAAKLQALAPPDAMVISDVTHRQIGQLFECEALGTQPVAGFSAPVRAWRPLHETFHLSRFKASRAVRTSFVGRAHEFSLLADRWRTASEGTGRTVLILGEAGMGKSRLVEALHDSIAGSSHSVVTWQCSPYHQIKALYPVVEYVTHAAGIAEADGPGVRLKKLTALLETVQMAQDGAVALFAQLLAIPPEAGYAPSALPPDKTRAATITALSEWMRRIAILKPLLFVLEDAHWIDATTLELLASLIGSASDVPLLTVITARPEFVSPWTGRAEVSILGLDRLNSRDCEGLVREMAASLALQNETVKEIVSRSDGNPLFVEELSAAVLETQGSAGQGVPDSLQSSLMARLDQLGDAKQTAQVCSVLGRRFARPLLMHVADLAPAALDANLSMLVASDIIRPLGGAGEGRYEFKHALVRDAAYESLLLAQRRRLHEACGRQIERSFPEAARAEPELLAQHFRLAGLPREASAYAEQAGDRAATAHAMVEAFSSYEDALRQAELLPESPERDRHILALLLKLGPALVVVKGIQNPELRAIYHRAEALSRAVGDADALFKSVWGLWFNTNVAGELDKAAAFAQELV
ncbi:MAG TPA: AAA family ATPase, partial [Caulobacteraceae bacterium]|nr:AAA family ATPase [Caulobacteraceae bacterium]